MLAIEAFDYAFSENGLTAYKFGKQLPSQSFIKYLGETKYKTLVNFLLHYLADMDVPIKRCVLSPQTSRVLSSYLLQGNVY